MKVKPLLHLHLLLAGLSRERVFGLPRQPAMEKLLAAAGPAQVAEGGAEAWLCRAFGVAFWKNVPAAPYTALADGLDAGTRYCLRVDPAYLQLLRDRVVFAGTVPELAPEEVEALTGALNQYFHPEGLRFLAPHPERWYLLLDAVPDLQTLPPLQALGRDVAEILPRGADAGRWRGWLNAAQMVLYAHPLNQERERRGLAPVNSFWPWGGGILQTPAVAAFAQVWADDPLARGLGQAAGTVVSPLASIPATFSGKGSVLFVYDARSGLPDDTLSSALQWLQRRAVATVHLHLAGPERVHSFSITRTDLWKVWRRPRPLETYLYG